MNVTGQILLTGSETEQGESTRITLGVLPGGVGSAGNLTIHAGSLVLKDGGFIKNSSQTQDGSAGNIEVYADSVNISGTGSSSGLSSGLFTSTIGRGNAGNITINTGTFYVADGAALSARTTGDGQGGNITVNASRSFEAVNGGQIVTTTSDNGNAGSIVVDAKERVTISGIDPNYFKRSDLIDQIPNKFIPSVAALIANNIKEGSASALLANAQTNSTGAAGNLTINTGTLQVYNEARVFVQSQGTGNAGNLTINAGSIRLDNNALLTANTQSTKVDPTREQATININSQNLIMRRGSNIFTNATGENVIGGNININTNFLVAVENSDISANSRDSRGGNVRITAQGIFGTQFRDAPTSLSDITATGVSREFSGNVELITPDVDPSRGLVPLTIDVVDVAGLVDDNICARTANSSFTYTGRGGLPNSPNNTLNSDAVWEDWRLSAVPRGRGEEGELLSRGVGEQGSRGEEITSVILHRKGSNSSRPNQIVEAQGWIINQNGEVILTAIASTATPHKVGSSSNGCQPPIAK